MTGIIAAAIHTGKAQVVLIATNPSLGEEMKAAFPYDFHIGFKRMRVFFPMASGPKIAVRHRWYDVASLEYEEQRAGILHGLLRNLAFFSELVTFQPITKLDRNTRKAGTNAHASHSWNNHKAVNIPPSPPKQINIQTSICRLALR